MIIINISIFIIIDYYFGMNGFIIIVTNYNDNMVTELNTYLGDMCVKMDITKYSLCKEIEETFEVVEFKCLFDAREYVMNFLVSLNISSSSDNYPIILRSANYKIKNNEMYYFGVEHCDFDYCYDNFFKKVLVPHEESGISDMCDELSEKLKL
jgi:hypothetical protein